MNVKTKVCQTGEKLYAKALSGPWIVGIPAALFHKKFSDEALVRIAGYIPPKKAARVMGTVLVASILMTTDKELQNNTENYNRKHAGLTKIKSGLE